MGCDISWGEIVWENKVLLLPGYPFPHRWRRLSVARYQG